ncbi:MAG: response regulator [Rhodospirillaceae bacterium]|nr:response regulator [Rhodospirillaceae bacterium]
MDKPPDYSSKRFLIVDDETFMLGLIDRMLKQCNAGLIVKASDGGAALRSVKDNFTQVDCIISDCNMKPVNGLQLLQGIRMGVNPRIPREQPFIMLTGHGETDLVKAAIALDVNGYVVKPVAFEKLVHTIDKVLKRPGEVKDADYYRAIKIPKIQSAFGQDQETKSVPWTLLPRSSPFRSQSALKEKIEQFKIEHATQDGVTEVKMKNKRECPINELLEGQILAQDIEAEEGVTLLRKGTRLSKGMITRLRELAGETQADQAVWIGELAD